MLKDPAPTALANEMIRVPCPLCASEQSSFERRVRGLALERCSACGFVFMNPQYTPRKLDELYRHRDTQALVELYSRITSPAQLAGFHAGLALLEEKVPAKGRLLDFGCGPAHGCESAARRGWDAHGLDLGEWCRVAAEARGVRNVHIGYLHEQGFSDGFFDAVAAFDVVEHLPDPKKELRGIRRVLRTGGWILIQVPNYASLSIRLGRDDFRLNEPPQHVNFFEPRTARAMLADCGYSDITITSGGGLKFENILGRPYRSDITEAVDSMKAGSSVTQNTAADVFTGRRPWWKRALSPIVEGLLYKRLHLGMGLRLLARAA